MLRERFLRVYLLYGCIYVLVFVSPPQTGQYSRRGLVCPSQFAPCLREGRGRQLDLQFFISAYKYESKRGMQQPSTAQVTAACVAPHLLRIILFTFIKSFPSLQLSHPARRRKPVAVRLSVVFLGRCVQEHRRQGLFFNFCYYYFHFLFLFGELV